MLRQKHEKTTFMYFNRGDDCLRSYKNVYEYFNFWYVSSEIYKIIRHQQLIHTPIIFVVLYLDLMTLKALHTYI